MEPEFLASAAAMLREAAAGTHYDQIAAKHGVTKTTVSFRVRWLALALQQVVGVLDVDEHTSPTASSLRRHCEAYLEALEHFRPGAVPALFEPPQTITPDQLDLLQKKIAQHSQSPRRDKALLLALFSTGAKPLEIAQLIVHDYLDAAGQVKTRSLIRAEIATNNADRPLLFDCPATIAAIDAYLAERCAKGLGICTGGDFRGLDPASPLFVSTEGRPLRIVHAADGSHPECKEMHDIYRRIFKHGGMPNLHTACARRMTALRMRARGASAQDIGYALGLKCAAVQHLLKSASPPLHAK